jgi:hypothetical protein
MRTAAEEKAAKAGGNAFSRACATVPFGLKRPGHYKCSTRAASCRVSTIPRRWLLAALFRRGHRNDKGSPRRHFRQSAALRIAGVSLPNLNVAAALAKAMDEGRKKVLERLIIKLVAFLRDA